MKKYNANYGDDDDSKFVIHGPENSMSISQLSFGQQIYNKLKEFDTNKVLLIDGFTEKTETIGEFLRNTRRLADCLTNELRAGEEIVTISSENNFRFLEVTVAAFYAAISLAPINQNYTEVELNHVLSITHPTVIFSSNATYRKFLNLKRTTAPYIRKIIVFDYDGRDTNDVVDYERYVRENSRNGDRFEPVQLDTYNHVAAILCSSGTTGLPKGVQLTHRNLNARILQVTDRRLNNYKPNSVFLGWMPFFHGFGFVTTIGNIFSGHTTVVMNRVVDRVFLQCVSKYRITHLYMVPPLILFLAKSPLVDEYDLSCIEEIGSSAAPLGRDVENILKNKLKSVRIFQAYGLTETTLGVLYPYRDDPIRSGSSGKIVPGMSVRVRDPETGRSLGPNRVGELCFSGPMVTSGYYKNYTATKAMFDAAGWLLTGDLAYYDDDGYFYVVDRLKELIKYKGFQVAPAELEAILLKHAEIKDAAVVGVPHPEAGEVAMAYVVKQPGSKITEANVIDYVADQVSKYKRLHGGVRFIDEIPKNPSGKILRRVMRQWQSDPPTKSKL